MKFVDSTHSYTNNVGESYTGVTTLIKQYKPPKDWQKIAEKYAKKHKRSVTEVQAAWREEGRKGVEKGIAYHTKMEKALTDAGELNIGGVGYKVIATPVIDDVKIAIPLNLEEAIYPELIVYSDKYKVAGQADLVEIVNGVINIRDYKTSKEIKMESFKDWKGNYEMMLFPMSHLMNCDFTSFSLQLNIYMYLLKTHNRKLKIGEMEIHHIITKEDMITGEETEILHKHPVPNMQTEAKRLLEHHYEQLKYVF